MITLIKVLSNILFAAGFLSITVLASAISYYGKPELGLGILVSAIAILLTLLVASAIVSRRHNRSIRSAQLAEAAAAAGRTKTYSAQATEAYEHDAHTVWSLIRPAESAELLSDVHRAFAVPGTPTGVGEQQCFISHDGSVSIVEVIGEDGPWWATMRHITPSEMNRRSTYRLEPTSTGCTLTVGTVIELPVDKAFAEDPKDWWETQSKPYLTRIKEVLSARQT